MTALGGVEGIEGWTKRKIKRELMNTDNSMVIAGVSSGWRWKRV